MSDTPECPRCGGAIPNEATPGLYPGALSRVDNETEICSRCGTDEAMWQFNKAEPLPPLDRPVFTTDDGEVAHMFSTM